MDASRKLGVLLFTGTLLSCLYHMGQAYKGEQLRSILDTLGVSKAELSGGQSIINPFDIIAYIIRVITFPIRIPYRLILNLIASFALLLLGCRVVPEVDCGSRVADRVPEFLKSLQDELEFYAGFADDTPAS